MDIKKQPTEPVTVVGIVFAEHVAREAMEQKIRHPLRDNEAHAALIAISAGELLCRCHLPAGGRSTPDLLAGSLAALLCDEAFVVDEAPKDSAGRGSAVEVVWATRAGNFAHSILPYRVENGAAVWEPASRHGTGTVEADSVTALFDGMSAGFDGQATELDRDVARETFGRLGVHVMFADDADALFDVDRGDPCPCGSGLLFGECHDA